MNDLTYAEVKKILYVIDACEEKSKWFLHLVKRHGFSKAWPLLVERAWRTTGYTPLRFCRVDITNPLGKALFYDTGEWANLDVYFGALGVDPEKFLRRFNTNRMIRMGRRVLKKHDRDGSTMFWR